jgi:hypothetical protein
MRAPLHQRTKKIGACIADPFANGEGAEEIDTLAIPGGAGGGCIDPVKKIKRVRVSCQSRQCCELTAAFYRLAKAAPGHSRHFGRRPTPSGLPRSTDIDRPPSLIEATEKLRVADPEAFETTLVRGVQIAGLRFFPANATEFVEVVNRTAQHDMAPVPA